jgi:hypothetical protein
MRIKYVVPYLLNLLFLNLYTTLKVINQSLMGITNQSIIVWTLRTKSLLPSLYKREEFALFGKLIFTHKRGGWTQGAMLYAVNMKKSLLFFKFVIPAEAGIQVFPGGPGFPFSRE